MISGINSVDYLWRNSVNLYHVGWHNRPVLVVRLIERAARPTSCHLNVSLIEIRPNQPDLNPADHQTYISRSSKHAWYGIRTHDFPTLYSRFSIIQLVYWLWNPSNPSSNTSRRAMGNNSTYYDTMLLNIGSLIFMANLAWRFDFTFVNMIFSRQHYSQ